jgi:hypothetical protein
MLRVYAAHFAAESGGVISPIHHKWLLTPKTKEDFVKLIA